jgi:hypothetical protein
MEKAAFIVQVVSAVATAGSFVIVLSGIIIGKGLLFKNETLFGKEAEDRYNAIKDKLSANRMYSNAPYGGGNKLTPQFEVERFRYDAHTMPAEWKGLTKIVRYFYDEGGGTMVKIWRL